MKLTTDEETALALAAQRGDMAAKNELFRHQRHLVKWIVNRYHGPDPEDLFSAGCEGWLRALRSWRPRKGTNFRTWLTFWVRAYASRLTKVWLNQKDREVGFEIQGEEESLEHDIGDEGLGAEEMTDGLWRRQANGILDGMRDRRLAIVLQERMKGHTLDTIARTHGRKIGVKVRSNGREWVRQLEMRALVKARALVRA